MNFVDLFVNEPLFIKIIVVAVISIPSLLSGGSFFLHFKKKKRHKDCQMYPSMLQNDNLRSRIQTIKEKTILAEQMAVVASANAKIMFIIRKAFLDIAQSERDISAYGDILLTAKEEVKDYIRKWLRVNHYTSKSEIEFQDYINSKIKDLLDVVTYHLDRKYKDSFFTIPRADVCAHNESKVIPEAQKIWEKMFRDCREISRNNEELIKTLQSKIEP